MKEAQRALEAVGGSLKTLSKQRKLKFKELAISRKQLEKKLES